MNKGDKVIYEGLVGIIEDVWTSVGGTPMLSLVAVEDKELSCSAPESQCEPYNGEEIDQSDALADAHLSSARIRNLGESLTDKYFRDGCH